MMELAYDSDRDAVHGVLSAQMWCDETDYHLNIPRYESRWQARESSQYPTFEGQGTQKFPSVNNTAVVIQYPPFDDQGTQNLPLVRNHSSLGTRPWPENLATDIQYPPYEGQGTEGTGDGFKQGGGAQDERYQPEERTSNKPPGYTGELKELETMVKKMVSKADSLDRKLAQLEAWMEDESQGRVMQPRCESWHHPVKDIDDQDRNPYHQEGPDDEMTLDEDAKGKYVHGVDEQTSAAAKHQDPCQDRVLAIAERGAHQDSNDSGFEEKQEKGTCVEKVNSSLTLGRKGANLDVALDLDILFSSLEFRQLLDGFDSSHGDDQQAESCEELWWIEEDFEEESELESRMSGCDQSTSSTSVEDQMKQQEDLLAEWSQIEAELGMMDVVKPAGKNTSTYESTGMEMEAVLADWYLIEESLKAEEQLKDVGAWCAGNDGAMKIKIEQIVLSTKDRIKDIVATAQE